MLLQITCSILFVLLAVSGSLLAKEPPRREQKESETGEFTFRVPVDVVVVNATATDKQGKPIKDLRREDFRVYEDGKLQAIHTFSVESSGLISQPAETAERRQRDSLSQPEPAESQETRYITIVFDDVVAPSFGDLQRSAEAVKRFVKDVGPADRVALMTASGSYAGSFSGNRQEILDQLTAAASKFNYAQPAGSECPKLSFGEALDVSRNRIDPITMEALVEYTIGCAAYLSRSREEARSLALRELRYQAILQNEEYQSRTRSLLQSLRQYVRPFSHFEGRKLLIFLSAGFVSEDVRYELQDVVMTALRSGVVMNTIDIRGLYTTIDSAREPGLRSADSVLQVAKTANRISEMSRQKGPLFQLANETGGAFVQDTNDLEAGLRQIVARNSTNYILSYASPASPADGRYHIIKLEVLRPGVRLDYRKGYYSPKQPSTFAKRKTEDIRDALSSPGELNEIPIEFSYDCLRLDDGRFELSLVIRVQADRLPFQLEDERQKNLLHFLLAVFDENGRYVDGLEKALELKLTEPNYQSFKSHGFSSKAEFTVPAGRYQIKAVVRESVHSKMGSLTKKIQVP